MEVTEPNGNISNTELVNELIEIQNKYELLKITFDEEIREKEEERKVLEKLIDASEELIQLHGDTHNYSKILHFMMEISGAKYAALNIFDSNGLDFSTVAFSGIKENFKKGFSLLGFDLTNKHWKYDPLRAEKTRDQTITRFEQLQDLTNDVISKSVINLLVKTFSIGEVFIVKVSKDNKVLGDFTLLFSKGDTLLHPRMVNLFVHQVGLFIERNTTINSLKESEARHTSMISNISDIIEIVDYEGVIKYVSPNIEKWFGWRPLELIGTQSRATVHPEDLEKLQKMFLTLQKRDNSLLTLDYRYKCSDGIYKHVELTATNLFNDQIISGVLLNFRDITYRKKTETELQKKNDELTELNAEKDKFYSIIAHDLRNPFNSFLGLTQILVDELPNLTGEEIHEIAENLRTSAINLFRLLENLLEWSRIKQGLVPVYLEKLELLPVINESLESLLEPARIKRITIAYDVPAGFLVKADSNILQTILRNLVSNSVKFTPKGGKIILSARTSGDNGAEISVKDSGIGMSQIMVDNLFRLDFKTNRKGTDGEPSTGLGLIICKDFIDKLGGKIRVETEERKGTLFQFTLPGN